MDNPDKMATYGTQGEEKQSKSHSKFVGQLYKQASTNNLNKT
jgi:hypothetical protein